jgi:hypothetical protein
LATYIFLLITGTFRQKFYKFVHLCVTKLEDIGKNENKLEVNRKKERSDHRSILLKTTI